MRQIVAAMVVFSLSVNLAMSEEQTKKEKRKQVKQVLQFAESYNKQISQNNWKQAEIVVKQAKEFAPDHPVVNLMELHLRAVGKQETKQHPATPYRTHGGVIQNDTPKRKLVTKSYPVADLVIPIPDAIQVTGEANAKAPKAPQPDFDSLITLIKETFPLSANEKELADQILIQPFETNLSLVIRHTPEKHEEIASLLEQLRRLQDVQVTLEFRFITVPQSHGKIVNLKRKPSITLSHAETQAMIQQVQSQVRSNIMFAPKITLFDGQAAEISNRDLVGSLGSVLTSAAVSADRRKVRLGVAIGCQTKIDVLKNLQSADLLDGNTLLIDITSKMPNPIEIRQELTTPMLSKIPYTSKLFKNVGIASEYHNYYLLVTPRIIIQEEEEELLNTDVLLRKYLMSEKAKSIEKNLAVQ